MFLQRIANVANFDLARVLLQVVEKQIDCMLIFYRTTASMETIEKH